MRKPLQRFIEINMKINNFGYRKLAGEKLTQEEQKELDDLLKERREPNIPEEKE